MQGVDEEWLRAALPGFRQTGPLCVQSGEECLNAPSPPPCCSRHARYSSYASAYQQGNCHRLVTEPLLYEVGVDVVLTGHVHAYERTWPVYNWTLDDCGPVHITLGNGGNIEKLTTQFVDSPGACDSAHKHGQSYSPFVCTQMLYDGEFCPRLQPEWSAMRWVGGGGCW